MSAQLPSAPVPAPEHQDSGRNRIIAGVALILIGLLLTVTQVFHLNLSGEFVIGGLGLIFLIWGLASRKFGLIIPGGILAGIAVGIFLSQLPLNDVGGTTTGGLFLIGFSLGWALITLLSPITCGRFEWWPLIPGAILGGIGAILMAGGYGLQILTIIGFAWPLILVGVGIYLLVKRGEEKSE